MTETNQQLGQPGYVENAQARSGVVIVCEHASNHIPAAFDGLGLAEDVRQSHIAWDPGAGAVARQMSRRLNAPLVASGVSRLVYDCNRPPGAESAMPARSETYDIPGNSGLDAASRLARVNAYYEPFRAMLADTLGEADAIAMITVHSFTPVYFGLRREVEIGILHDTDTRLADVMLACAGEHTDLTVRRNEPYGAADGVTHTLREHGVAAGRFNVMIEVRNDLIADKTTQDDMADMLANWVAAALRTCGNVEPLS